ncbi:hypothetical protein CPAR01_05974 [Colletotrichum paranaense]|uniref:Uncharacterized protein n=1 Tax=Colletotrichum paranaense TaxID=1914294 RepID=A0ABQ9SU12_9PEZI|nr:uncharacterized protein CPAR01_05974 [Colletotrichum paranaense]KAK1542587.1 hypothetical protein CPAR01_05974 [Colletotrichum paranaense]
MLSLPHHTPGNLAPHRPGEPANTLKNAIQDARHDRDTQLRNTSRVWKSKQTQSQLKLPQEKELQRQNNPRHTHGDKTVAITSSFSTPLQPDRATLRITTSYNGRLPFRPLLSRPCRCVAVPLHDPCRVHRHSPPPPAALKAPSLAHHAPKPPPPPRPAFAADSILDSYDIRWESGKGPNPIDTTKPPKSNQKGQRGHPICNWS